MGRNFLELDWGCLLLKRYGKRLNAHSAFALLERLNRNRECQHRTWDREHSCPKLRWLVALFLFQRLDFEPRGTAVLQPNVEPP